MARTKAQGRLLLFWVGCVCPTGVLYAPTGSIQPQTANMAAYCFLLSLILILISQVIVHVPEIFFAVSLLRTLPLRLRSMQVQR